MPSLADITVKPDLFPVKPDLFPEGKQKQWVWERKGVKGENTDSQKGRDQEIAQTREDTAMPG